MTDELEIDQNILDSIKPGDVIFFMFHNSELQGVVDGRHEGSDGEIMISNHEFIHGHSVKLSDITEVYRQVTSSEPMDTHRDDSVDYAKVREISDPVTVADQSAVLQEENKALKHELELCMKANEELQHMASSFEAKAKASEEQTAHYKSMLKRLID